MKTIDRLKKYMEEKEKSMFEISLETRIREQNIKRWIKGEKVSEVYENILKNFLTSLGY